MCKLRKLKSVTVCGGEPWGHKMKENYWRIYKQLDVCISLSDQLSKFPHSWHKHPQSPCVPLAQVLSKTAYRAQNIRISRIQLIKGSPKGTFVAHMVKPVNGGNRYASWGTRRCSRQHWYNQSILRMGLLMLFNENCKINNSPLVQFYQEKYNLRT